jgi:hypothetical protein
MTALVIFAISMFALVVQPDAAPNHPAQQVTNSLQYDGIKATSSKDYGAIPVLSGQAK